MARGRCRSAGNDDTPMRMARGNRYSSFLFFFFFCSSSSLFVPQSTADGRFLPQSTVDGRNQLSMVDFWQNRPVAGGPHTGNLTDRFAISYRTGVSINCWYGMYQAIPSIPPHGTLRYRAIPSVQFDIVNLDSTLHPRGKGFDNRVVRTSIYSSRVSVSKDLCLASRPF
ncbi:hypothetical protein BHE74_00014748 [Ensete ventricosum]|nr:hypothetical protein BHE74_00014748 [Ensete ventricosum]